MQTIAQTDLDPSCRLRPRPIALPIVAMSLCGTFLSAHAPTALCDAPSLPRSLPSDGVVTYVGSGSQSPTATRSTLELTTFLADQANQLGLLSKMDECSRMWIDSAASLTTLTCVPHAVILFDVRADLRADGGHELAGLKLAIVMYTKGANADIERRIQHFLNTYTNTTEASLSKAADSDGAVYTFRDRRLPGWAVLQWGQVGQCYVLAIGDESFARVAASIHGHTETLQSDTWFHEAFRQIRGRQSLATLYLRFDRLIERSDESLAAKIRGTLAPLGLGGVQRGLWTIRQEQRSVESAGVILRHGETESLQLSGQRFLASVEPPSVPMAATGYAAINLNPGTVLRGVSEAYLASQSPKDRQRLTAFWDGLAEETDVSIERDIFSYLSKPVIVHNYPPHLFRLPLAWTFQFPIRNNADKLRRNLDRLLEAGRQRLDAGASLQLHQIASGNWFIQFGLAGPAVAVTDRWLIISYSPQAVQQNLELLSPGATRR